MFNVFFAVAIIKKKAKTCSCIKIYDWVYYSNDKVLFFLKISLYKEIEKKNVLLSTRD